MNIFRTAVFAAFFLIQPLAYGQSVDTSFGLKKSTVLDSTARKSGKPSAALTTDGQSNSQDSNAKDQRSSLDTSSAQAASGVTSDVFGANLFSGAFAKQGSGYFSPDYALMVGDKVQLRFWGGFEFDGIVEVDPRGNIFIPHVGPVAVLGTRNDDLQKAVEAAARKVYRANVYSYASLAAAQPVRVFVGGFVIKPGLYYGTSLDSVISYLDQAGGIDPMRGSFLNVQVKRGNIVRTTFNLYDFLVNGKIPQIQLGEGDVIFVSPRQSTVKVNGLVASAKIFEFSDQNRKVEEISRIAKPLPQATHLRVTRNTGVLTNVEYMPLEKAGDILLNNGDELEFTSDKKPGTITVRVEGEHLSAHEYVLPYGSRLGELLEKVQYSERSDMTSPQLFRLSVKERQKQLMAATLKSLESSVLTARSGTAEEAVLRAEEAKLVLQWVARAKSIEPNGQVLIAQSTQRQNLLLENGDVLKITKKDGLVLVGGEVIFPNTVVFDRKYDLDDYIQLCGGYTQNADTSRIVVVRRDGSVSQGASKLQEGDEILILPRIDVKSREIAKDLVQMMYQIAIAAKVVLGL